ncbi:MAG: TrkH family potassium uptake protein [Fusicatenibacter sp.]
MNKKKKSHLPAERIMVIGFASVILLGTVLLSLPCAAANGQRAGFLDALFTATTSVCVTGLVTVPTATYWSTFGKVVILLLIQFGGLGIMACLMMFLLLMKRRISLQNRKLIQDTYNLPVLKGAVGAIRRLLIGTFTVEGAGAVCYSFYFVPEYGWGKGIAFSVFHAVSAFCNAGIDIVGESSFVPFLKNPLINLTTMGLIVLSGLGFPVWWEVLERIGGLIRRKYSRRNFVRGFTLHTKLVLATTGILIVGGAVVILLLDWNHPESLGRLSTPYKVMAAFFQSITTRTAGFETIPQKNFTESTALVCMVMMFIGGSPMGTAGGVKTTTIAIIFLMVGAYIKANSDTEACGRKVAEENLRSAVVIFFYGMGIVIIATTALIAVTGSPLLDCLYEIVSAVATVGLTRSLTPGLPPEGKCIVIAVMFMGRIGPITLAVALTRKNRNKKARIERPEQQILVG